MDQNLLYAISCVTTYCSNFSSSQVNMIKDDGTVIHFNNPKVQASLSANTFAITGHAETKQLTEMLPGILSQLGADSLSSLRKLAEQFPRQGGCRPYHLDLGRFTAVVKEQRVMD